MNTTTPSTTTADRLRPTPPSGPRLDRLLRGTVWAAVNASSRDLAALRKAAGTGSGVKVEAVDSLDAAAERGAKLTVLVDPQSQVPTPAGLTVVVADGKASMDRALTAVRAGAADYLPGELRSIDPLELRRRLRTAAAKAWADSRLDRRLEGLARTVRRLDAARRTVSQKVDLLCSDLVDAYGDVARRMEDVRLGKGLTDLLGSAADLEQLLCHLMDWLLRHGGNANLAIFLNTEGGQSELGAYMKHTVDGTDPTIEWLEAHAVVAAEQQDGTDVWQASAETMLPKIDALQADESTLVDHAFMAIRAGYLAEPLATIVLFRRDDEPLTSTHADLLRLAAPAFATALTNVVRDDDDEDDGPDDEWWQRGEASPY